MGQTFDFGDGNGPVPAHRHSNGGGWVAETARVGNTAYVGPDARVTGGTVSDGATVSGNALVTGGTVSGAAVVTGNARVTGGTVTGDAWVTGGTWNESPPQLVLGRWTATVCEPGWVAVGCERYPLAHWEEHWGKIANEHDATAQERALLLAFLEIARAFR